MYYKWTMKKKKSLLRRIIRAIFITVTILLLIIAVVVGWVLFAFRDLVLFLPHYTDIAGQNGEAKSYLVVFQNNNELRPAGGFLTAYGIANFQNGYFRGMDVKDVYVNTDDHPYMEAPYPLEEMLDSDDFEFTYTFRDSNYSPDFAESAKELEKMLLVNQPDLKLDGVFAVNYSVLENLIGVIGEVEIGDMTLTKDNLFEQLEFEVNNIDRHNIKDLADRKNILGELSNGLIKGVAGNPYLWTGTSRLILDSLNKKEIQLNFKNRNVQELVMEKGWSGMWPKVIEKDFLGVVEANLGGLKNDRYITRDISYHLMVEDDIEGDLKLTGTVEITLKHNGIHNMPISGSYKGYVRTFLLRTAALTMISSEERDSANYQRRGEHFIVGNKVELDPGQKKTITYKYDLPESLLKDNEYSLYVPKQSGTLDDFYDIRIEFPQGYKVESDSFVTKENLATKRGILESDWYLDLKFFGDEMPPYPFFQKIDTLDTAVVIFNEKLDNDSVLNINNFTIEDLDVNHPEKTDRIKITGIQYTPNRAIISLEGMSLQYEEHYRLIMKDLMDDSGNMVMPSPKTLTLVQRLES